MNIKPMKTEYLEEDKKSFECFEVEEVTDYIDVLSYYEALFNGIHYIGLTEYGENTVISDEKYASLEDLKEKRKSLPVTFKGILSFYGKTRTAILDTITKKLFIAPEEKPVEAYPVQYFKDAFGNIIKLDNDAFYCLERNETKWIRHNEYLRNYRDGDLIPINYSEERNDMKISKIVITGGPCAGKSTAMSWIQNAFRTMGYTVLFVPETATELITGGVAPWSCGTNADFQKCLFHMQLEKEKTFVRAAKTMDTDKVLIVCDRGALDNKAYMTKEEFSYVLSELNSNEVALRDNYDAVFHLVTAAKGAESFYTTANNTARTETVEQAREIDDKLISAWTGHPHLRVIDNSSDFEDKMRRLIREISSFLGEPHPLEIERKYLIEYPDLDWLSRIPNCEKVQIIQTYLRSNNGDEIRVRQRGAKGNFIFFQTIKRKIDDLKRVEIEQRLSETEYLELLMNADITKRQIRKDRYCLTYENQYFEIDVYPFWDKIAIAEIELSSEDEEVKFPEQIKVIREVTTEEAFKNASLAGCQDLAALEKAR